MGKMAAAALLALAAVPAHADTISDAQFWLTNTASVAIDDKTWLTGDVILRSHPDALDVGQYIARVGVRRSLGDGWTVQATYGWIDSRNPGGGDTVEHRLGQMVSTHIADFGAWRIDSRLGVEERLRATGGEVGWRVRARLRATRPLTSRLSFHLSEELIGALNDTAWGQNAGLTASRLGTGINYRFSNHLAIGPSYSWQRVVAATRADRNSHVLGLTIDADL
ncbi:MAG: DUF2490 domain-containing protein [Sphingomonadaceae bacterium]|nr:DUF2490 domain-containing protein [Sphingomonadaceae bacterium]